MVCDRRDSIGDGFYIEQREESRDSYFETGLGFVLFSVDTSIEMICVS